MSSNVLARVAGWSSILSVLVFVVSFILTGLNSGKDTPLTTVLFLVSNVLIVPVFYALYVFHRAQAQMIALIALILGTISMVLALFAPTPTSNPLLFQASSALFGIAILIFGYLGFQNAKMPRALAISAILIGVVALAATALALSSNAMSDMLGLVLIILYLVWALWLGWLFLKGKLL